MMELSDEKLEKLKDSIPKKVGERVIFFRNRIGLTQTELGGLVGKDRQYIYKIEKGVVTPNIVTICGLCIAMEIPFNEFFDFGI